MAKKYIVTGIEYDTDGEDVELPEEILIEVPDEHQTEDKIEEYISEEITIRTGFCHLGVSKTPEIQE